MELMAQPAETPIGRADDRFADLQRRMSGIDAATRAGRPGRTMLVVPSRTVDKWHEPAAETQAYEERLLCLLLMLRDPGLSMVYVTSSPIAPGIVDYYLSLLPRALRAGARARLTLVAAGEASARPLAEKLLERPRLLTRLRWAIRDRELCHLVPYTTTALERDLALALDVPLYGADPVHAHFGTKSGCRELFARAGVPHPPGSSTSDPCRTRSTRSRALRAGRPELAQLVMKLNEGVSGEGNAIVDLRGLPQPGAAEERQDIAARLEGMALEAADVTVGAYLGRLADRGGIVEERITGRELRSPSVQLEITPAGEVRIVSTHDQLLGGPSGQSFLGCRFPADPAYARAITGIAAEVGRELAAAGVIGRSAIDFVDGGAAPAGAGSRTRSRSTCARAGRRIRSARSSCSPAGATVPRPPRSRPRPARRGTTSRPTISRRRSCAGSAATACSASSAAAGSASRPGAGSSSTC